jgi:hypothetical protein
MTEKTKSMIRERYTVLWVVVAVLAFATSVSMNYADPVPIAEALAVSPLSVRLAWSKTSNHRSLSSVFPRAKYRRLEEQLQLNAFRSERSFSDEQGESEKMLGFQRDL